MKRSLKAIAVVLACLALAGCDACFNWRLASPVEELQACKAPAPGKSDRVR